MKVQASVSFGGQVSMYQGEQRELEGEILRDLLQAGYVTPVQAVEKPKRRRKQDEGQ